MSYVVIIGGGPAGLMAADVMSQAGHDVTICDAMPSVGRKFLMAGKSGLNLTKDEPLDAFVAKFGDIHPIFEAALRGFGPVDVMSWTEDLEQAIFTGTTGRVFPKAMKASPLLRALLTRLRNANVQFKTRYRWSGFDNGSLLFDTPEGPEKMKPDATILAMGGASWTKLGSNGAWAQEFNHIAPFKPANMGFHVAWSDHMVPFFGQAVKATALHAGRVTSRGEWVISARGVEGGGIYEVAATVRDGAELRLDLAPDLTLDTIKTRLMRKRKKMSRMQYLKAVMKVPPAKAALFNEFTQGQDLSIPDGFASAIKSLAIAHNGPLAMDGAISTAGGMRFSALDGNLMLKDRAGIFAAGEMLDWEAPTGGYLINGCLATGRAAGMGTLNWLISQNQRI